MVISLCFPASATVQPASGEALPISALTPYQKLLTVSLNKNGKGVCRAKESPFYTYLHFESASSAEFLVFKCETGLELIISGAHLLFKRSSDGRSVKSTMAKNITAGDRLLHLNDQKELLDLEVLEIETRTLSGVFAPLTKSGTLFVNGFLVSSYAHVDSQFKAHASLAPLRLWYQLRSRIGKGTTTNGAPKDGIHGYAQTLASIYGLA